MLDAQHYPSIDKSSAYEKELMKNPFHMAFSSVYSLRGDAARESEKHDS
jgi:hypothetical protein